MAVDYDLVIIGASAAGIHAAVMAAQLKARVALVEQDMTAASPPELVGNFVLPELGQALQQVRQLQQIGWLQSATLAEPDALWAQVQQWAEGVTRNVDVGRSPALLASLGIEVIAGSGEFYRKPALGFVVNGRQLRSRAYLLAIGQKPAIPDMEGLETAGYLTLPTLLQPASAIRKAKSIAIIGIDPAGVELAQIFNRLELQVFLIVPSPTLLPLVDSEAAQLVQAQLEADGVQVLTKTTVSQVRQIEGKKWLQAGDVAIAVDEILLASGWESEVSGLNLEAAQVHCSSMGISLNTKLQTTNPRIYACTNPRDCLAPYLDIQQATVAVKNALFLPVFRDRQAGVVPVQRVATQPELAWMGLTETEALRFYGKNVVILRQSFKTLTKAKLQATTTGFCKLILHRNGKILGAHIVGAQAGEMIGAIALAMQQNLKIQTLAQLVLPSPTFAEVIHQTAAEWQRLRLKQNLRLQDWLAGWFSWQRSRLR